MKGHMNNETVHSHADAVFESLQRDHKLTLEQIRRICTTIVRKIGSLRSAKEADKAAETAQE